MTKNATTYDDIHHWFDLSYAAYFVVPRLALQSMPLDWQKRWLALMAEFEESGMKTPSYHVLRAESEYTFVEKYDKEDETSRDYEFTALTEDPWANYRRGDISKLCPEFKA